MTVREEVRTRFISAATWHGALEPAQAILVEHPDLARGDLFVAAILGDATEVRRLLALDPGIAARTAAPYDTNALVLLCLSKYLRFDSTRTEGFMEAARVLLDAGVDPNSGFTTKGEYPERETALYGAAGVAHHLPLTRLLLERGADPNDEEVVYHSPESDDSAAMLAVVDTGRVTREGLALMLIRKSDWHDYDGMKALLDRGADPRATWSRRGLHPLNHAIARDNSLDIIELLLDHGADPAAIDDGESGFALAARRGRGDLLERFERHGLASDLTGAYRLMAACARNDAVAVEALLGNEPGLRAELLSRGGELLALFAGTWNTEGVRQLLDLGVPVDARFAGDSYFDIAGESTALHVAAWKGLSSTVELLIERGADVNAADGRGRTPLVLGVKACVDSFWTHRRTPQTVRALLAAGASARGVTLPTGYDEIDVLLRAANS